MLKYATTVKINNIQKALNPRFVLGDILVAYHGKNRNRSNIPKELFEKRINTIYGIPIVGEWIYDKEDGLETWGNHGGKVIVDTNGIEFMQTTVPYGFVPKDAMEGASWVTILEDDGHTEHEYILLKGCVFWANRYKECMTIVEKDYGQSMEIVDVDGYEDGDYFNITDFVFDALCILGDKYPPCFEKASVMKHKSKSFKHEFDFMFDEYNNTSEGEIKLDFVKEKITSLISQYTYNNTSKNVSYPQYHMVDITDTNVYLMDRAENYRIVEYKYTVSGMDDDRIVSIDFEHGRNVAISYTDESTCDISIDKEIDFVVSECVKSAVDSAKLEYDAVTNGLNAEIGKLNSEVSTLRQQVKEIEAEKERFAVAKHKEAIDGTISSFEEYMGSYSNFMEYKASVDYGKSVDHIKTDLQAMHSEYVIKNQGKGKTSKFNYVSVINSEDKNTESMSVEETINKIYFGGN